MSSTVAERIKYPSYKSFDDFIDVEWLRSLDGYVTAPGVDLTEPLDSSWGEQL